MTDRGRRGRTCFSYLSRVSAPHSTAPFPFFQGAPGVGVMIPCGSCGSARGCDDAVRWLGARRGRMNRQGRQGRQEERRAEDLNVEHRTSNIQHRTANPAKRRARLGRFCAWQKLTRTESLLRDPIRVPSCGFVAIFIRVPLRFHFSFACIRVIRGQREDLTAETQRAQRAEGATARDAKGNAEPKI